MSRKPQKYNGTTEARIEHIAGLMRQLKWVRGATGKALAKEWGLTHQRVRELAAESSKRVMADIENPSAVLQDVGVALRTVIHRALADDDRKSVIDAGRWLAVICGASAPQRIKQEVTGNIELIDIADLRKSIDANNRDRVPSAWEARAKRLYENLTSPPAWPCPDESDDEPEETAETKRLRVA